MKRTYGHRFSNRSDARQDILFQARHAQILPAVLDLKIPLALRFMLALEIRVTIEKVLKENL